MLRRRKRKESKIEYAFMNRAYYFEEITSSIPWAKIKYLIS